MTPDKEGAKWSGRMVRCVVRSTAPSTGEAHLNQSVGEYLEGWSVSRRLHHYASKPLLWPLFYWPKRAWVSRWHKTSVQRDGFMQRHLNYQATTRLHLHVDNGRKKEGPQMRPSNYLATDETSIYVGKDSSMLMAQARATAEWSTTRSNHLDFPKPRRCPSSM
jgi:hypothetical protein